MSFIDRDFAWFLPLVFGLSLLARGRYRLHVGVLLAGSLVFYGFQHWWFVPIIAAYCVVDWVAGLWIERAGGRRTPLVAGVVFNLAVLCFWKYLPLALTDPRDWIVPMGVSFYSFTGIAYMTDVHRGVVRAERSLWRYSLFTVFFPHLVAGPILRAREFLTHLGPGELPQRPLCPLEASCLIARGFFKKLILADSIAIAIDPFFANVAHPATAGVWALPYLYLYAFQIFFDFSGYTDIARGLGLWFGFRWPENFRAPYLAASVQEFWRRWHMTLSRFLRDYLYIPLGGNRSGPWRSSANLMITMLLGGLWHGAGWTFLIWGGLHGLFLIAHRAWRGSGVVTWMQSRAPIAARVWNVAGVVLTFHAVCFAWCFFRLTSLPESLACVRKLFVFDPGKLLVGGAADAAVWLSLTAYAIAVSAAALFKRWPADLRENAFVRGAAWGGAASLLAVSLLLAPGRNGAPFLYFQF